MTTDVNALVKLQDIIDLLSSKDFEYLKGNEIIPPIQIQHGPCCCCTKCGRFHDDCVCEHNELLAALLALMPC